MHIYAYCLRRDAWKKKLLVREKNSILQSLYILGVTASILLRVSRIICRDLKNIFFLSLVYVKHIACVCSNTTHIATANNNFFSRIPRIKICIYMHTAFVEMHEKKLLIREKKFHSAEFIYFMRSSIDTVTCLSHDPPRFEKYFFCYHPYVCSTCHVSVVMHLTSPPPR